MLNVTRYPHPPVHLCGTKYIVRQGSFVDLISRELTPGFPTSVSLSWLAQHEQTVQA